MVKNFTMFYKTLLELLSFHFINSDFNVSFFFLITLVTKNEGKFPKLVTRLYLFLLPINL